MFRNKFNRKLKRILALSTLGTLCCSQNVIVNASTNTLVELSPADRNKVLDNVWLWEDGKNKLESLDGQQKNFSWKRIAENGLSTDDVYIIAVEYKDDDMRKPDNVICVKEKMEFDFGGGIISILPYKADIFKMLKEHYKNLGDEYKLPDKENIWWTDTNKCVQHLKDLEAGKNKKKDTNEKAEEKTDEDKPWLDRAADATGLPKWGVVTGLCVTPVAGVGLAVWMIKSTGSAVGEVIHGSGSGQPAPVATTTPVIVSQPAPIIINNGK